MKGYNKNVRPTEKSGDITPVYIKMTLTNLISLVGELHSTGLYDMMPISAETLKFHGPLDNVSLEWKGRGSDDQRVDRNGEETHAHI